MNRYQLLLDLLNEGNSLGIDLKDSIDKVQRFIETMGQDKIKIVLLGSFSDGKTTLIGGLLGKLLDNMKIDQAESSDQLEIYKTSFLGKEFEIVDTPGLFGTKEKEVDGKNVKFSDITIRYISEANIMIYVCDAVNPFKDSHAEVMRRILIDYDKLNSTIFVINKMDEAGTIMLDDEDYERMSNIKKENLIKRLHDCIQISSSQEKELKIVCVAADPKGKGLSYWFSKSEDYYKRSHLQLVANLIKSYTDNVDKEQLKDDTQKAVVNDVLVHAYNELSLSVIEPQKIMKSFSRELDNLQDDIHLLETDLKQNKKRMSQSVKLIQDRTLAMISNSGLSNIVEVMQMLGIKEDKLTMYRLIDEVSQILSETSENNDQSLQGFSKSITVSFSKMDEMAKGLLNSGIGKLKGIKLSNLDILKARNSIAKMFNFKYKFKPGGAGKLAGKINGFAKWGGVIISGGLMIYDLYSNWRNAKKLEKVKADLTEAVNKFFSERILPLYTTDSAYYENFAPSYITLSQLIEKKKEELSSVQAVVDQYDDYRTKLKHWFNSEKIEYVDFEEI